MAEASSTSGVTVGSTRLVPRRHQRSRGRRLVAVCYVKADDGRRRIPCKTALTIMIQVCLSGHRINSSFHSFPARNKAFCPKCGEPTITACPRCTAPIKGYLYLGDRPPPVPAFCDTCGMTYPWQVSRAAAAIELLRLEGIPDADVQDTLSRTCLTSHAIRRALRSLPHASA